MGQMSDNKIFQRTVQNIIFWLANTSRFHNLWTVICRTGTHKDQAEYNFPWPDPKYLFTCRKDTVHLLRTNSFTQNNKCREH